MLQPSQSAPFQRLSVIRFERAGLRVLGPTYVTPKALASKLDFGPTVLSIGAFRIATPDRISRSSHRRRIRLSG
jgi:hypothetical protein